MGNGEVLVLGATGIVGSRVTRLLRDRAIPVRAASRAGPTRFDWGDPAGWGPCLDGVEASFVMAPDGVEVAPEFLQRARSAGVDRIVLLSSKGIEVMGDHRLLAAEQAVRSAGGRWTIVRPDWFDQNFDEGVLRDAVLTGEIVLPVGEVRQAFNDADDIAAVVSVALVEDGHDGRVYELSGPQALSFDDVAAVITRESGRPVRFSGAADRYAEVMTGYGLDRRQVLAEVEAFEALAASGDAEVTDTVTRVTGRTPVSFDAYAARAAARRAWNDA
jgi:uncharacterized protein YbjT (DUF2867 family)